MSGHHRGSRKGFHPGLRKILSYRSSAGFGVRLDGAMGDTGRLSPRFMILLLVKITASGPNLNQALGSDASCFARNENKGVKTNIPFLENVISHKEFVDGRATTKMIDVTPELFKLQSEKGPGFPFA